MSNVIDLTTVAQVNDVLNQTESVDADYIAGQITAYSQSVLTRTGRGFLSGIRTYNERYNGSGSLEQALRNYPIQQIFSLSINGQAQVASSDFIAPGYVIDTSGNQSFIALISGQSGFGSAAFELDNWSVTPGWSGGNGTAPPLGYSPLRFVQGIQNVAVSYLAGYLSEASPEVQDVPATEPYTVTADFASQFYADQGVTLSDGTALTFQPSGVPGSGEYSVFAYGTATPGVYVFNAAQASAEVNLSYQYGATPADLSEAAARLVAMQYRRRRWLGQVSVNQPGIGTTSYSRLEMELDTKGIIDRYRDRRVL